MGRQPDGPRLVRAVCVAALLPLFMGGGLSDPSGSIPPPPASGLQSKAHLWVFFQEDAWNPSNAARMLAGEGARILVRSDWLRGFSVEVAAEGASGFAFLPGVREVRPVASLPPAPMGTFQVGDTTYGGLRERLEALGIPQAHQMGFQGSGVRVGILDGTFLESHLTLRKKPPLATRDFVDQDQSVTPGTSDPPAAASHGTALWSLVAGDLPGVLRGGAPSVDILLARVRGFDELSQVDEDRWVAGLEWLESQGARIVLSGIGFREFQNASYGIDDLDGDGTPATRAADQAARRGVLVVAPVGNGGPAMGSLEAPADGDSVLAVGAVDSRGRLAAFSASGPTGDGRPKPDLFAPGLALEAASAAGALTLEPVSGTEFAAALLTGALALAVEAHPDRGPMELVEVLRRSVPEVQAGEVGIPKTAAAILFPDGLTSLPLQEVTAEGQVTSLAPFFQWTAPTIHPVGLPVTFHLELSEDSLFTELALADSVVGTFARRLSVPLPPRTRLFWRVRGVSVQGVERVTNRQPPVSVPSWVTLKAFNEPSGSEIVNPQPEFVWASPNLPAPAGPLVYELQVLSDRGSDLIQSHPGLEETSFSIPDPLPFNLPMRWRVIAQARNGLADTVTSAGPFVVTSGASPPATILYQNFPNPFPNTEYGGMETRIWFDLARATSVELRIYDVRGRLVRQLIPGGGCGSVNMDAGLYGREDALTADPCVSFSWEGLDDRGKQVEPGVYLLRLRAGGVVSVRRVVYWP